MSSPYGQPEMMHKKFMRRIVFRRMNFSMQKGGKTYGE